MSRSRSIWLEPIFQIPLVFLFVSLIGFALFRFFDFGWGNNIKWMMFWLGAFWISLMWTITLPLDRIVFQGLMRMPWNFAGQLALGNALFWTVATLGVLLKLLRVPLPNELPYPLFPNQPF